MNLFNVWRFCNGVGMVFVFMFVVIFFVQELLIFECIMVYFDWIGCVFEQVFWSNDSDVVYFLQK